MAKYSRLASKIKQIEETAKKRKHKSSKRKIRALNREKQLKENLFNKPTPVTKPAPTTPIEENINPVFEEFVPTGNSVLPEIEKIDFEKIFEELNESSKYFDSIDEIDLIEMNNLEDERQHI